MNNIKFPITKQNKNRSENKDNALKTYMFSLICYSCCEKSHVGTKN